MHQIHPTHIPSIPVFQQRLVRGGVSQRRLSTPPPSWPPEAGPRFERPWLLHRGGDPGALRQLHPQARGGRLPPAGGIAHGPALPTSKVTKEGFPLTWLGLYCPPREPPSRKPPAPPICRAATDTDPRPQSSRPSVRMDISTKGFERVAQLPSYRS